MGGVGMTPGGTYQMIVPYYYEADWKFRDAVASTDPKAKPFGERPWAMRQGLIWPMPYESGLTPTRGSVSVKPVLYLPVKRREGKDVVPTVIISIKLYGPGMAERTRVPIWAGTSVEVEVVNVLKGTDGSNESKLKLPPGKLDKNLTCEIEVPVKDVASWLAGTAPLRGRVNENLFDFRFKLNGVTDDGQPVVGQARRRLFLYCRKTVVFLPGLFASQVQFTAADGQIVGFPDFWDERALKDDMDSEGNVPINELIPSKNQRVEVLECDDKGIPLIPCPKPTLLMLKGVVIDPFDDLRDARAALLPHVPKDFRLYSLIVYPYDWRCDLTDAAAGLLNHLGQLQSGPGGSLRNAPDTDDQVAVMGHSTGGVVIRRALAPVAAAECTGSDTALANASRPPADKVISLAFFLSVPFSGAPKAGSVLLTGCEAPEGKRQIPFIEPESLVSVSLSMPIVYHLHTSNAYKYRPSTSPSRPPGSAPSAEADKAAFVEDALTAGLMPRPWVVRADAVKDPAARQRLAFGSQPWHQFVRDFHAISSGHSYLQTILRNSWQRTNWFEGEVKRRGLQAQMAVRHPLGWNIYLAERARKFHEKSAKAVTGVWKARACVLWGSCEESFTFRQINLEKIVTNTFDSPEALERKRNIDASNRATVRYVDLKKFAGEGYDGGRKIFVQYERSDDATPTMTETGWRLSWVRQLGAGDGTVPSDSQLAEQPPHTTATLSTVPQDEVEAPEHMDSTKSDSVWLALVRAIHAGKFDKEDAAVANARAVYADRLTHKPPAGLTFNNP